MNQKSKIKTNTALKTLSFHQFEAVTSWQRTSQSNTAPFVPFPWRGGHDNYEHQKISSQEKDRMLSKKEIFERIAEVQQEVLLGDVVKILRALNEDIDDIIEEIS